MLLKSEASCQGRPPTALGDLDGGIEGKAETQAAGQATWPADHLTPAARTRCTWSTWLT